MSFLFLINNIYIFAIQLIIILNFTIFKMFRQSNNLKLQLIQNIACSEKRNQFCRIKVTLVILRQNNPHHPIIVAIKVWKVRSYIVVSCKDTQRGSA